MAAGARHRGDHHGRHDTWWRIDFGVEAFVAGRKARTALDVDGVSEVSVTELPGPTVTQLVFEPAPLWAIDEPR